MAQLNKPTSEQDELYMQQALALAARGAFSADRKSVV